MWRDNALGRICLSPLLAKLLLATKVSNSQNGFTYYPYQLPFFKTSRYCRDFVPCCIS